MYLVSEDLHSFDEFVFVRDSYCVLDEGDIRFHILHTNAENPVSLVFARVEIVANGRINWTQFPEGMHDNFISAKRHQRRGTIGTVGYEDRERLRKLAK